MTIDITGLASADRQLWLMAVVTTGTPPHPAYYAKEQLTDTQGAQQAIIRFLGSTVGSSRNLVIESASKDAIGWLRKNLKNDGNPAWDIHRVNLPRGVVQVSRSYKVTRTC